jgi:hypothetical protein
MQAASPRHPWKALAVVLLVFAAVHGARAHADLRDHDFTHVHVVHAGRDCAQVDVDLDDDDPDDAIFEVFDDDAQS